ncbi:MAG TPA: type II toxin-antitoxin system HicA family toxin [Thermodesulfobacteriota bacterium]|nr:type II toxin-antitoxin system HicA family toxin [Thermodesulfobacteriota bacterium]
MPRLYSSKEIERVLNRLDFKLISQKGSHGKFKGKTGRIVILPMNKKEIPLGTFKSLLRQIGISHEDFTQILEK